MKIIRSKEGKCKNKKNKITMKSKSENSKGSRNRVKNQKSYDKGYNMINWNSKKQEQKKELVNSIIELREWLASKKWLYACKEKCPYINDYDDFIVLLNKHL